MAFLQTIPKATELVTCTFDTKLYVGISPAVGTTFYKDGVNVTEGITGVAKYSLIDSIVQIGDQTDAIVDNNFTIFYVANSFQITTNTLP